jgi:SHS2 domain-containing protein
MSKNFYELIDHTADIGIVVRSETREELFQKAALAAFDIIGDLDSVKPKERVKVEVGGEDDEELMVNWLNELIFLFDAKGWLFSQFDIEETSDKILKATCSGEKFNPQVHRVKTELKAATYHDILVSQDRIGWSLRIIFDV